MKRRESLKCMVSAISMGAVAPLMAKNNEAALRLPLDAFARRPLMQMVALSPNGKRLAAIVNSESGSALVTRAVDGGPIQPVMNTDNLGSIINWVEWVNNDRLVLSIRFPSRRQIGYVQTIDTMESRLLAVNADGSQAINLIKERGSAVKNLRWAVQQDRVLDWLPEDGKHVLLALPASEDRFESAIYKVNVYTAERSHYADSRRDVYGWITDNLHRPRVAIGRRDNDRSETFIEVCDADGRNWRLLTEFGPFSKDGFDPLGFGLDPDLLYVSAKHQGLDAVFTLNLRDPKALPQLKLAHPRYDLDGALVHDERGEAVGIHETLSGDSGAFYWGERYKSMLQALDEALPQRRNYLYSGSSDGRTYVVRSAADGVPSAYYLVRFGEDSQMSQLANSYPELQGHELPRKKFITLKARDGLELPSYLTLPDGPGKKLPLVVFPHGGPQAADGPEFDSWVSFMVNRGCAVLQVNFRGSTGYGFAHMEAGLRRWGLEMQEDLEDAVAECMKRGVADASRIAIVGASYGGYAALMGVVKTPDLYKGAFAFAPVTDLVELTDEEGQYSSKETIRRQIGNARDDKVRLQATSPNLHADKIKVPVVLIHGTQDRQAKYQHSVWMAEALKAAGKEYKFLTQDKGDHQLSHFPYRRQLFQELEAFLDKVLDTKPAA